MVRNSPDTRRQLVDAAEQLLIAEGRDAMTTRRIARAAGVNHGLVHYHFGSVDHLVAAVLDRFGARLIARQRQLYARNVPFIEKWRAAMGHVELDLASGDPKLRAELQAMALNDPELRAGFARATGEWRTVLTEAFSAAVDELGLSENVVQPFVTLVMTFTTGMLNERLVGIDEGHESLLQWFDAMLVSLQERTADG